MPDLTSARVDRLERRLRATQALALAAVLSAGSLALSAGAPDPVQDEVRTRSLVVVDSLGRERVVIAAPLPDPVEGPRSEPSTGLQITDPDGYERFAVGLMDSGRLAMGFDAPRGTGDERNRERIAIAAEADGSAYVHFLNRQTAVPARLYLDDDDRVYLEFLEFGEREVVRQRLGFGVADTLRDAR